MNYVRFLLIIHIFLCCKVLFFCFCCAVLLHKQYSNITLRLSFMSELWLGWFECSWRVHISLLKLFLFPVHTPVHLCMLYVSYFHLLMLTMHICMSIYCMFPPRWRSTYLCTYSRCVSTSIQQFLLHLLLYLQHSICMFEFWIMTAMIVNYFPVLSNPR